VIRKLMIIPPEQFEPPLERDPRVLSFRFLLSNSPVPRHGATRSPARPCVCNALVCAGGESGAGRGRHSEEACVGRAPVIPGCAESASCRSGPGTTTSDWR